MEATQNNSAPTSSPQILTTVQINGNQMVSFQSGIDWAESMTLTVESPDADQCIKRVSEWLSELEIYPWGNLADCQEYANQTQEQLTDPLIYAQIREYVLMAHSKAFTYLPMQIGYLTVAFTFRRVDLTFTLEEETEADIQNQIAEFTMAETEAEHAARQKAIELTQQKFNYTINIQSTKMPFLVRPYKNEEGVVVTGAKKPELRGELKDSTVSELMGFILTVGTNITAPDDTTTVVTLAQHTQALVRLKESFIGKLPKVGTTFEDNCEIVVSDEEHGLCIKVGVSLID